MADEQRTRANDHLVEPMYDALKGEDEARPAAPPAFRRGLVGSFMSLLGTVIGWPRRDPPKSP
jgi:hypothetical protein